MTTGSLKRASLGDWEVTAQSVASVAPTTTPAIGVGLVYASSGNASWLSYALATLAVLLVAANVNVFACRTHSAGAFYTYVRQGIGPLSAITCGWALVIAYLGLAATSVSAAAALLTTALGVGPENSQMIICGLLVVEIIPVWWITYRDVKLSTRFMLGAEVVSIFLITVVVFVAFSAKHSWIDRPQLRLEGLSLGSVHQGLIMAIMSFVGFESATTLGYEAKDPGTVIPRAIWRTVLVAGVFFAFTCYAIVASFRGYSGQLATAETPLKDLAIFAGVPILGEILVFGAALSFIAGTVGALNAGARILFTIARHGIPHSKLKSIHSSNATPHVAVSFGALIAVFIPLLLLATGMRIRPIFECCATVSAYGFIVAYLLVSVGAAVYLRKEGRSQIAGMMTAGAATVVLLVPLVGSVYPPRPAPFSRLPYIYLTLMAIGLCQFLYIRRFNPNLIEQMETELESVRLASQD